MGSGHFLVEACRFLGEKLYEACRSCDEKALEAERKAETAKTDEKQTAALEAAQIWRQRIIELPDPDDELAKTEFVPRESKDQALEPVTGYLPSTSLSPGVSTARAQAICRRLVAVHCVYGVDKNPLAVELAKLALWLESHAEGMPLTFLDHRLVVGDSLTGPFWDKLMFRPGKPDTPVEDLFSQGIYGKLKKALTEALGLVRRLESSVGSELADVLDKEAVKTRLDQALLPFRVAVAAWAGGVMLGPEACDDLGYGLLLKVIGDTGALPNEIESDSLRAQIARGLALDSVPSDCAGIEAAVVSPVAIPALSYDLTFPEVFYSFGVPSGRQGFHGVLGNPPWDRMLPADKDFFAAYNFSILDAATKRERQAIQDRAIAIDSTKQAYDRYIAEFRDGERSFGVLYDFQVVEIQGERTIGKQDAFRLFMERCTQLASQKAWIGIVVPSAFHANEGASGIRRLFLERNQLRCCYSFENRRKLFEIDSRFKFATVVAQAGGSTDQFSCAFYLHDDEWLFGDRRGREPLSYSLDFVRHTGGEYLSLLELRSKTDLEVAQVCFESGEPFGEFCNRNGIRLGRELNITDDAWRFTPTGDILPSGEDPRDPNVAARLLNMGYLVLHEGKTFRQYDDRWAEKPRFLVSLTMLSDKENFVDAARYYRLAHRKIAGPGDENVSIWAAHPPGVTHGDSSPTEVATKRPSCVALSLLGVANATPFDYLLGLRVRANVLGFIRDSQPLPRLIPCLLLSHSALRLTCNHALYAQLWREQLGDAWREPGKPPFSWPVLANDDDRWHVRASIDAVVGDAYGLYRDQYAHVLSTFKHTSYPKAPELCLARFDELKAIGLDAFTKKHDPYWDIPLNENLSQPVIDLPVAEAEQSTVGDPALGPQFRLSNKPARQRAKRKR